jgi:hypothetical protein
MLSHQVALCPVVAVAQRSNLVEETHAGFGFRRSGFLDFAGEAAGEIDVAFGAFAVGEDHGEDAGAGEEAAVLVDVLEALDEGACAGGGEVPVATDAVVEGWRVAVGLDVGIEATVEGLGEHDRAFGADGVVLNVLCSCIERRGEQQGNKKLCFHLAAILVVNVVAANEIAAPPPGKRRGLKFGPKNLVDRVRAQAYCPN